MDWHVGRPLRSYGQRLFTCCGPVSAKFPEYHRPVPGWRGRAVDRYVRPRAVPSRAWEGDTLYRLERDLYQQRFLDSGGRLGLFLAWKPRRDSPCKEGGSECVRLRTANASLLHGFWPSRRHEER